MLTTNQIEALQPGERRQIFAMGDGSGLSLRVEVSGKKKWVARRDGKLRTLGDWPDLGIREAKAAAIEAIADPVSFAEVWDDWFHTEVEPSHKRPENARSLRPLWRSIEGRRVDSLKRAELVTLMRKIKARAPARAIRATSQLRSVLTHAVALGIVETNVMLGVPMSVTSAKGKPRDRVLSDDEIRGLKGGAGGPHTAFLMFCLATLCRRGEAGSARRSWLDGRWMRFPLEVMKSGRPWDVYLSDFAWAQVPPSNNDTFFTQKPETVEAYVDRWIGQGWTPHDLRRTGATITGRELSVPPHVIAACLAHAMGRGADVAYMHGTYDAERRDALERLGRWLDEV